MFRSPSVAITVCINEYIGHTHTLALCNSLTHCQTHTGCMQTRTYTHTHVHLASKRTGEPACKQTYKPNNMQWAVPNICGCNHVTSMYVQTPVMSTMHIAAILVSNQYSTRCPVLQEWKQLYVCMHCIPTGTVRFHCSCFLYAMLVAVKWSKLGAIPADQQQTNSIRRTGAVDETIRKQHGVLHRSASSLNAIVI